MSIQILQVFNKVNKKSKIIIERKKKEHLSTSTYLINGLCVVCVLFYQVIRELNITNIFKWALEMNAKWISTIIIR